MELERLLHSQGFGTRKECRALVRNGWLEINGVVCEDPFLQVEPEGFEFTVDDEPWRYREKAYVLMHKPAGYECSQAPKHHPSVYSLLPEQLRNRGLQSVGRLDEDTTGLLLLTDDGQFIHALSSPKRKVAKVYEATLRHPMAQEQLQTLLNGVLLHGDTAPVRTTACELLSPTLLRLTITEGKYHQVKRMVAACSNRVESLRRIAVGGLSLPENLAPGSWIWLDEDDLARLWQG
ncbi:MAG TPA: 16S rRNA pseudouridine(516) synthase [Azospira sp.]|nr:16S rRNA pseudouridine(516) synthase [Azospira sp.]